MPRPRISAWDPPLRLEPVALSLAGEKLARPRHAAFLALLIGIASAAWLHVFVAFAVLVVILFGFRGTAMEMAVLVVPPPIDITLVDEPPSAAPRIDPPKASPGKFVAGAHAKEARLLAELSDQNFVMLSALSSSKGDREGTLIAKRESAADVFEEGGVEGGVSGIAGGEIGDLAGIGGLGLRGTGTGDVRGGGGTAYGIGGLSTRASRPAEYRRSARMRILVRWRTRLHAPPQGNEPIAALVDLVIAKDGSLHSVSLRRSSGIEAWDEALLAACRSSFSEPPEEMLSADGLAHLDAVAFGATVGDDGRVIANWVEPGD